MISTEGGLQKEQAVTIESKDKRPVPSFEGLHTSINTKLLTELGKEKLQIQIYCI